MYSHTFCSPKIVLYTCCTIILVSVSVQVHLTSTFQITVYIYTCGYIAITILTVSTITLQLPHYSLSLQSHRIRIFTQLPGISITVIEPLYLILNNEIQCNVKRVKVLIQL